MHKAVRLLLYSAPLLLTSRDALAWGLYTHVYFAQLLIWSIPLLDPHLRRAVGRFPQLAIAGACLPDLALVGPRLQTDAFDASHRWETVHAILEHVGDDADKAIAVGYASHLLVDVIAHNHFVPAHEKLLADIPWVTHVAVEWAMDAHVSRHAFTSPGELLGEEDRGIADFAARHFACEGALALRAVRLLAKADRGLRSSRVPEACYRMLCLDRAVHGRFDSYVHATAHRLGQINRVLGQEAPAWEPDFSCPITKRARLQAFTREDLRDLLPLPQDLFEPEGCP
jgi:Zinc dependent phospholipase C